MQINIKNGGHSHELSIDAIRKLQDAKNAQTADDAFENYARHVPRRNRNDVWFAVDDIQLPPHIPTA